MNSVFTAAAKEISLKAFQMGACSVVLQVCEPTGSLAGSQQSAEQQPEQDVAGVR